ncbi:hypothetical protein [Mycolicibacterium vanbaalenii]|uniref:hypothetical protein n=1 Tax=Mycolicibacterium vanbaalenii TaxID=110539 RepID=UPI0013011EA5|nr:hypothetical protein [Mycolicibacterium vanbaalenii]MCV7129691.1 hypothetical protein [Mycolicibacterium vanbaalenii PYR-1]
MDDLAASAELTTNADVMLLRSRPSLRIVVGGWSASGKTIFARYLADLLQCEYVSASSRLVSALMLDNVNWIRDRDSLKRLRSPEVERQVDRDLTARLSGTSRIVLDSWTGAFLSKSHDAAVWIECDLDVRAQNAMGPDCLAAENPHKFRAIRSGLAQKDRDSVEIFRDLYGFSYDPTSEAFPINIDITKLISPYREHWWHERHSVLFLIATKISQHLAEQI